MASSNEGRTPSITSHDTALCVILPSHVTEDVNRLRELYDNAYEKWPPHINLLYPFVAPESLHRAVELVQSKLANTEVGKVHLRLDTSDFFTHKRSNTVYVTDRRSEGCQRLERLRRDILDVLGQPEDHYQLHLTVGQSEVHDVPLREYLLAKARRLPPIEWQVSELAILIRERSAGLGATSGRMRLWGTVKLSDGFPFIASTCTHPADHSQVTQPSPRMGQDLPDFTVKPEATYYLSFSSDTDTGIWKALDPSQITSDQNVPWRLSVASYNVLVESIFPAVDERYHLLLRQITISRSDVLILQEVCDDFLCFLLDDKSLRERYMFVTHGPPDQEDIGPLPSLRNIVVLSQYPFTWEWVPFQKRHKGAVVLQFPNFGTFIDSQFFPLVVAGIHLTCGLTDGSIYAKQSQLKTIIGHLSSKYPRNHWILGGDFNITTSSYTVDAALKRGAISAHGASVLSSLETMLLEAGLSDCFFEGKDVSSGDASEVVQRALDFGSLYEGEEGATFDPTENDLAANIAEKSYHSRPQRYDRILVKGDEINVVAFKLFGFATRDGQREVGSDHWGIRTELRFRTSDAPWRPPIDRVNLSIGSPPQSLAGAHQLKECLIAHGAFPSDTEVVLRKEVFDLIKMLLNHQEATASASQLIVSFVVAPVGSYRLGVWNSASDIDCLVLGSISPRTFFTLMVQKLRRNADFGVKLLRKVKAASGTMLELEVRGVRIDLQYCAATDFIDNWPEELEIDHSDYAFDLPMQSLLKLNPLRDMDYLQRTIPDLATFRVAYRFIKTWAKQRGIYSSKLGYVGGIHITLLLSRICKLAFFQTGALSASTIVCTFFKHYSQFDWRNDMVYDPQFYKSEVPRYHRSSREPMVILSVHSPKVNVAHNASLPSLRTLEQEFKRAEQLLSKEGTTWMDIVGPASEAAGANEFLNSYTSYAKIDVQYWGGAVLKGRILVGWLEWRCVSLLVDINRKFPDLHARIWPARFAKLGEGDEKGKEHQGCYLVGLAKADMSPSAGSTMSESDRRSAHISLLAILNGFAEQIRNDDTYFDASSAWVGVSLVKRPELEGLRIDDSDWGAQFYQEDDFDSEDDEDHDVDDDETLPNISQLDVSDQQLYRSENSRSRPVVAGPKLRPANDILNRFRWDIGYDPSNYVIGYLDRFLGAKEMPVARWKFEQSDLEFIPLHRILYFRRRSDGVKVWDRENRIDLIFGSGTSTAAAAEMTAA